MKTRSAICAFFALPRELRDEIYRLAYVVTDKFLIRLGHGYCALDQAPYSRKAISDGHAVPALHICRQWRLEASESFLEHNTFSFLSSEDLGRFLDACPAIWTKGIRSLRVQCSYMPPKGLVQRPDGVLWNSERFIITEDTIPWSQPPLSKLLAKCPRLTDVEVLVDFFPYYRWKLHVDEGAGGMWPLYLTEQFHTLIDDLKRLPGLEGFELTHYSNESPAEEKGIIGNDTIEEHVQKLVSDAAAAIKLRVIRPKALAAGRYFD